MKDFKEVLNDVKQNMGELAQRYPEQASAFKNFMEKTESPGKIDAKTKELISISLSVTGHCSYCIAYHVNAGIKAGASDEEILEAAWVAVLMGGGPALMYAFEVQKALKDLRD